MKIFLIFELWFWINWLVIDESSMKELKLKDMIFVNDIFFLIKINKYWSINLKIVDKQIFYIESIKIEMQ